MLVLRHAGELGGAVPQRQPQPAQPSLRAGPLQQVVHHEHRELPPQPPAAPDRRGGALLHHPVSKDAGAVPCHGVSWEQLSPGPAWLQTLCSLPPCRPPQFHVSNPVNGHNQRVQDGGNDLSFVVLGQKLNISLETPAQVAPGFYHLIWGPPRPLAVHASFQIIQEEKISISFAKTDDI